MLSSFIFGFKFFMYKVLFLFNFSKLDSFVAGWGMKYPEADGGGGKYCPDEGPAVGGGGKPGMCCGGIYCPPTGGGGGGGKEVGSIRF